MSEEKSQFVKFMEAFEALARGFNVVGYSVSVVTTTPNEEGTRVSVDSGSRLPNIGPADTMQILQMMLSQQMSSMHSQVLARIAPPTKDDEGVTETVVPEDETVE